jgi:hypothetical protein
MFQNGTIKVGRTGRPVAQRMAEYDREARVHDNPIVSTFASERFVGIDTAEKSLIDWMNKRALGLSVRRSEWFRVQHPDDPCAVYGEATQLISRLSGEQK